MMKALIAVAMLAASPAAAQSYIVNTGAGTSYSTVYNLSASQNLAGYFSLGQATTLTSVEGFITSNVADTLTISIYGNGTVPSGSPLYAGSFAGSATATTGAWQGLYSLGWTLAAGNYWVGFSSSGNDGMQFGVPSPLSAYAYTNGGTWSRYDMLSVGVRIAGQAAATAVPEPASWALMVVELGLAGAALRRRIRRSEAESGVRIRRIESGGGA